MNSWPTASSNGNQVSWEKLTPSQYSLCLIEFCFALLKSRLESTCHPHACRSGRWVEEVQKARSLHASWVLPTLPVWAPYWGEYWPTPAADIPLHTYTVRSLVQSIIEWATPTSCCEARRFTGPANNYCHFVEGYAKVAAPLIVLGSPTVRFRWTAETRACFDALKLALSSAPVLCTFDPARRAVLITDASNIAITAILT